MKRDAIRTAVDLYIRAWSEHDPAARAAMLARCWAPDGRLVTMGREIRGRAALAAMMVDVATRIRSLRLVSVVDIGATIFRFRGVGELLDGTLAESFDAGEIDANGQISLILTFAGPLADAPAT